MHQKTVFLSILALVSLALGACTTATPEPAAPVATEPPIRALLQVESTTTPTEDLPIPPGPQPTVPLVEKKLVLATTTSTQDSGLLDTLLPIFEEEFGVKVYVIAVGTGQALALGQDGNADVLLVHARAKEDEFMAQGHGVRRENVMYNDFVILGPESDPAKIQGMTDAVEAFKKIAETQSPFISRGDNSGTHTKELALWRQAEIEPNGNWYISAGQGMGEVLTMAEEGQAYTLSDRATYLVRNQAGLELVLLSEGDPVLFNPYSVIAVNPAKNAKINIDLANQFIEWIISIPVQEKIAEFGQAEFGAALFFPSSTIYLQANPTLPAP